MKYLIKFINIAYLITTLKIGTNIKAQKQDLTVKTTQFNPFSVH